MLDAGIYPGGEFCQGLLLTRLDLRQKYLIDHFQEQTGKRTMVIGHRGGYFGPENTLKSFRGAIENQLEGIEFDVSERGWNNLVSCRFG